MAEEIDSKISTIYEIVVSYFVDVYVNHIYNTAKTTIGRSNDGTSLTDEYRRRIQAYVTGIKTDQHCYHQTINDLFTRYAEKYPTASLKTLEDKFVASFMPNGYLEHLSQLEKDNVFSRVICALVAGLAVACTEPEYLRRIIDQRDSSSEYTARIIINRGINTLKIERDVLYNKFLKAITESRDSVPLMTIDKLSKELHRLREEKKKNVQMIKSLTSQLNKSEKTILQYKHREKEFQKLISLFEMKEGKKPRKSVRFEEKKATRGRKEPKEEEEDEGEEGDEGDEGDEGEEDEGDEGEEDEGDEGEEDEEGEEGDEGDEGEEDEGEEEKENQKRISKKKIKEEVKERREEVKEKREESKEGPLSENPTTIQALIPSEPSVVQMPKMPLMESSLTFQTKRGGKAKMVQVEEIKPSEQPKKDDADDDGQPITLKFRKRR